MAVCVGMFTPTACLCMFRPSFLSGLFTPHLAPLTTLVLSTCPTWASILHPGIPAFSACLVLRYCFCSVFITCTVYLHTSLQVFMQHGVSRAVCQQGWPAPNQVQSVVLPFHFFSAPGPCVVSDCGVGHLRAGNTLSVCGYRILNPPPLA